MSKKQKSGELFEKFVPDTPICIEKENTKILYEKFNRKDILATKMLYNSPFN